jgi:hypothetical protein
VRRTGMGEFTEDQGAPGESPDLIGIGEWDAAADAEVLGCVLLEDVADDPDESAEEEPEEEVADFAGVEDCGVDASKARTRANMVPSSPMVKTVTNESGFIPLM